MSKLAAKHFRAAPGARIDLRSRPTRIEPLCASPDAYRQKLGEHVSELGQLQHVHYAASRFALLLILQGMDTAGKDGAIRHVMTGVNPQGCRVHSFKQPSLEESHHDFLWRGTAWLPARGEIGIFNRSYYEEVVVVRVHPELLGAEGQFPARHRHRFWQRRYQSIVNFERHLDHNATRTVKIFLHLSREEQRRRLLARLDDREKRWKLSLADLRERPFWNDYRAAYEACLGRTGSEHAPWHIVPADCKEDTRLIVSQIVLEALRDLKSTYPEPTPARQRELRAYGNQLRHER